jgi:flagellar motor switch protein FliG
MLTGPEKAVLFLLSLDEDVAAPIMNELKEPELRKLRAVASTMREVRADALEEAYGDFVERSSSAVAVPRGGLPYLRRLTVGAVGEQRARDVFEDGVTSPLARLEAAPPDAVAALLEGEPPQLTGAVLARLEPATAAAILGAMSIDRQLAVLGRVTRMTELPAGALEDVATALASQLPDNEAETLISIDGIAKTAEILKAAGKQAATLVLERLEDESPDLAKQVRLAMFTFEELKTLDSRNMRPLLREIAADRITVALKGASDEVKAAIFGGLSSRAADLIRDDLELMGNVRKSEIERARTEIVEIALRLETEGLIDLGRGGE